MTEDIDTLDRIILQVLQEDGRITNQDLAQRCNLSPSACLERTRRLKAAGFIRRFSAHLDPKLLGCPLTMFIEVRLDRHEHQSLSDFSEAVAREPRIVECHMIAGSFDYLLKVRVADMEGYRRFLSDHLSRLPGLRESRSYAVLGEIKYSTDVPVLDHLD